MPLKGKVYDRAKFVAQIGLPALGTLYFALAGIWNLPHPEQVIGTIGALDAFLGVVLGISSVKYNKLIAGGTLNLVESDKGKTYMLEVHGDPEYELPAKRELRLKVVKHPTSQPLG